MAKRLLHLIGLNCLQSPRATCRSVDGPAGRRSFPLRVSGDAFSLLWPSFPLPWHCVNPSRGRSPVHCEMFYSSTTHCRRLQRQPDEATGDKGQRHCEYSLHLYPTGAVAPWSFPDVGPFGVALSHRSCLSNSHLPHISTAPPTPRTAGAANAPAARPSS
jgi:hypothetical protein